MLVNQLFRIHCHRHYIMASFLCIGRLPSIYVKSGKSDRWSAIPCHLLCFVWFSVLRLYLCSWALIRLIVVVAQVVPGVPLLAFLRRIPCQAPSWSAANLRLLSRQVPTCVSVGSFSTNSGVRHRAEMNRFGILCEPGEKLSD